MNDELIHLSLMPKHNGDPIILRVGVNYLTLDGKPGVQMYRETSPVGRLGTVFAMTPDEAEQVGRSLIEQAQQARGG